VPKREFTPEDLKKALESKRRSGRWNQYEKAKQEAGLPSKPHPASKPLPAEVLPAGLDRYDAVLELMPAAWQALRDGLDGKDGHRVKHDCMKLVLAYAWGKPVQPAVTDTKVRVQFESAALDAINGQ
jgi:hypothetical protein